MTRHAKKFRPDWDHKCENCGHTPVVGKNGDLCGPCYFGTADAVNGGWWDDGKDDFDDSFVEEHIPAAK